jgi:hypothetical protein
MMLQQMPVAPPTQKAIFGFGDTGSKVSMSNLVNSSGVVAQMLLVLELQEVI